MIDVHNGMARDMLKAAGPDEALTRLLTGRGFKPGSYGEQMAVQATKHDSLISHYDHALHNSNLPAQDRQLLQSLRSNAVHDRELGILLLRTL